MTRALVISILDQGILSGVSLGIGLALIRFATPEAVGQFALAMAVFFMFFSVQHSLASLPISTRIFGAADEERTAVLGVICTFDLLIIAAAAVVSITVLAAFGFTALELAAAVSMILAGLWRELARAVRFSTDQMRALVTMDCAAMAITVVSIVMLWRVVEPASACLFGLAIGNGAASLALGPRRHLSPAAIGAMTRSYGPYFRLTRWTLLNGVAWELQNRAYVFIVQMFRGAAANGALQAGRILVSPVELVAMAWSRVAVPRMAARVRAGAAEDAYAMTRINVVLMVAFALTYCAALFAGWDLIEHHLYGDRYPDIGKLVAAWGVFGVVTAPLRCLEWLFQALERFRELAICGVVNALGVVTLMSVLVLPVPLYSVLIVLTAGQILVIIALVRLLSAPARRQEAMA